MYRSDLDFKGVTPGQEVTVVLWMGDLFDYMRQSFQGPRPEGIKFHISSTDAKGRSQSRYGTLRVPDGHDLVYGTLPSGPYADSGWLLLQSTRDDKEGEIVSFAFLDFYGYGELPGVLELETFGKTEP